MIKIEREWCMPSHNTFSMLPSVFAAPRGKHSEKPAKFYELLRQKTPEPRIDIFGRRRHVGFDIYGDQAEAIEPMTLEAYNHEV